MQKQQGFIQGALLIGIALLAVVIGAFAMASNNNTSDTSKEKTKTNAAVTVKKMADAFEFYQITAAQKDVAAAETAVANLNITLPQSFTKNGFSAGQNGPNNFLDSFLQFATTDKGSCAQVNRVLGLATSDSTDDVALAAGTGKNESCVDLGGGSGGFVYTRIFAKNT